MSKLIGFYVIFMDVTSSEDKKINSYWGADLYQNKKTGFVYTDSYLELDNQKKIYDGYYQEKTSSRFGLGVELVVRMFRFVRSYRIKRDIPKQAISVLDIGCGRGFILYYLKKYFGFTSAIGTQMSKPAVDFANTILHVDSRHADLLDLQFEEKSFDVVIMLHVLEHVRNIDKYVIYIHKLLSSKGTCIIEVPNFSSWTRFTGKYWLSLDLDYHLSFYTVDSLIGIFTDAGFIVSKKRTFSFEYSIFTSTQSIVSWVTRTKHIFFYWLQKPKLTLNILPYIFLFIVIGVPAFFINLFLIGSNKGEVVYLVLRKKNFN